MEYTFFTRGFTAGDGGGGGAAGVAPVMLPRVLPERGVRVAYPRADLQEGVRLF
jgi:hypothetical protein